MEKKTLKEWRIERGITASFVYKNILKISAPTFRKKENTNDWSWHDVMLLTKTYNVDVQDVI